MKKTPKDPRDILWAKMEADIQERGRKKDPKLVLKGKWKKFVREQDGFKVYAVTGAWVRSNLSVIFGLGGHGYVHEFIPSDEIWIATHHFGEGTLEIWGYKNVTKSQKLSKNFFESTIVHEIAECKEMRKGTSYWVAHNIALEKEKEAGLLVDPNSEV